MRIHTHQNQSGFALLVALLMLLILTIIGISGMGDSILDLRMTGNIQSLYDSMQQADSGVTAVMSQRNTLFTGIDRSDIFASGGSNALKDYIQPTVNVDYLYEDQSTSRQAAGFSQQNFSDEYYIVDSAHSDSATGANTHVYQGVIRKLLPYGN